MNNIAYCGFNCDYCPIRIATVNNDCEELKRLNRKVEGDINSLGCLGCKSNLLHKMCNECNIKKCNLRRNISSCSECDDFPCSYVNNNLSELSLKTLWELKKEREKNDEK